MPSFSTSLIKTDVTSVKLCKPYVLCGIGSYIHLHKLGQPELIHKQEVFNGLRIYGIQLNSKADRLLCHGENVLKLFEINLECSLFNPLRLQECTDWILDAKWIDSDTVITTVSMHSAVTFWSHELELIRTSECEENCILYCAKISYDTSEELLVLSGTVFSEILVWKPNKNKCPVLARLCGHDGVLFSIDHDIYQNCICSTSDDRSVIIWSYSNTSWDNDSELISVALKHRMYGHSARVFGCKVLKNCVISTGEDGIVNVWNLDGTLIRKIDAHQGGSIWSTDADTSENIIITGGADSGVTVFPLKTPINTNRLPSFEKDTPKKVVLLRNNQVVVITDKGCIYQYAKNWMLISQHDELKSYALLEVSDCRSQIVLAGFKGHIFVYQLKDRELTLSCSFQTQTQNRIFSIHWLTCAVLLTCSPDGMLHVWRHEDGHLLPLHVMQLPSSKERWSTTACLCENRIAIGDRKGNVHLFSLHGLEPIQTINKAHNYLGISKLYYTDGNLISLGRNAMLRKYKLNASSTVLSPVSSDKLPFTWLTSLKKNGATSVLVAFSGSSVVFWDYTARRILLEIKCGGGHRSYDFNQNANDICFTFIKGKSIEIISCQWNSIYAYDLIKGINTDQINSLRCFKANDLYLISGGEDTTLRVSSYKESIFDQFCVLKSHLSSIRCLHLQAIGESSYLLFSAGGRAQIIMWKIITGNETICNELFSYYEPLAEDESEVRVMDLCTLFIDAQLYLLAACSDGTIKIYKVLENSIEYVSHLQYELKCILKITLIVRDKCTILVSMATDGYLVFWRLNLLHSNIPFYKYKANKSGINCYSITKCKHNSYNILTGGDDNGLTLLNVTLSDDDDVRLTASYSNKETHCAQITGVHLTNSFFLSASLDKKLTLFAYSVEGGSINTHFMGAYDTSISDVKGMEVFEAHDDFEVILYGLGIQIIKVKKS